MYQLLLSMPFPRYTGKEQLLMETSAVFPRLCILQGTQPHSREAVTGADAGAGGVGGAGAGAGAGGAGAFVSPTM